MPSVAARQIAREIRLWKDFRAKEPGFGSVMLQVEQNPVLLFKQKPGPRMRWAAKQVKRYSQLHNDAFSRRDSGARLASG